MINRQSFLWWREASEARNILVPEFATKAEIKENEEGYYLIVWWHSGAIADLTTNEYLQAQQGVVTC